MANINKKKLQFETCHKEEKKANIQISFCTYTWQNARLTLQI